MNIVSKILVGLIFVASLGFIYLAAATLQTEGAWQLTAQKFERQIEEQQKETDRLLNGGANARLVEFRPENGLLKTDQEDPQDQPGIRQLKLQLDTLVLGRGRVWKATRGQVTATGEIAVTIEEPKAHGIKDNSVLYVFDARPPQAEVAMGGQYLGEFKVKGAAGAALTLEPTMNLAAPILARELTKVTQSEAQALLLYEVLPTDDHKVFAGLPAADIEKMLPAALAKPFVRDGKEAADTDPPEDVVDGKYVRPLCDFATAFREEHRQMWNTRNLMDQLEKEKLRLDAAAKVASDEIQTRDAEIAALKAELEKSTKERDLVKAQQEAQAAQLTALQEHTAKVLGENKRLAAQWTERQLDAARKVDQLSGLGPAAK